jgi:predicted N-acetyltransferase YhbS
MTMILRPARPGDARESGRICYEGFETIGKQHNFPGSFPSAEVAADVLTGLIEHPGFYGVVAERDGTILGSNFVDERSTISGVGPISVDPATQNAGVGRQLMQHVLDRASEKGTPGVRLLQAAYHARALTLYAKLGFRVREAMAIMNGPAVNLELPGRTVRLATMADLSACNAICFDVHGHDRSGELQDGFKNGTALVVEYGGSITAYCSSLAFFGHAVGRTWDDLQALIGAVPFIPPPGILVPLRSPLFHWALERGLRVSIVMNLMSVGLYNEPAGAYLPSVCTNVHPEHVFGPGLRPAVTWTHTASAIEPDPSCKDPVRGTDVVPYSQKRRLFMHHERDALTGLLKGEFFGNRGNATATPGRPHRLRPHLEPAHTGLASLARRRVSRSLRSRPRPRGGSRERVRHQHGLHQRRRDARQRAA